MAVNYTKLKLSERLLNRLSKRFIAFDTETTGLDPYYNHIIEVGAVLFENGKPVNKYGSLIHSVDYVPYEAQAVNHISNEMVRNAPPPDVVYPQLVSFLGDAIQGNTVIVGHNATFDMKFLAMEMVGTGRSMDLIYADTCALSRTAFPSMYSHTQDSVARKLGVINQNSHRAVTDAQTCGEIMVRMIPLLREDEKVLHESQRNAEKKKKSEPNETEKAFCEALARMAREAHLEDDYLCFQKSGKLLHVRSLEPLFSVSLTGKKPYLVGPYMFYEALGIDESQCEMYKPCCAGEQKLYGDTFRIPIEDNLKRLSECLIRTSLKDNKYLRLITSQDAEKRWKAVSEMELYWKPE
ncbi:MAG: 3'-5' exonuclease, partial [Clostridia bacterium]|nr:3'-5' exonuclease [Clostridia bacterium]